MPLDTPRELLRAADGPGSAPANATPADQRAVPSAAATAGVNAAPPAAASGSPAPPAKSNNVRRTVLAAVVLLALAVGGRYGYDYVVNGWYHVSTDDAYVQGDVTTLSAKVSGFITAFPVAENTPVSADTIIAEIDDGDYRLALQAAQKKAETQRATIDRFDSQIAQADAGIAQAKAQIVSADAAAKRTEADFVRYSQLLKEKAGTQQRYEQAIADRDQANAAVVNAKAALANAEAAKVVLAAQQQEARRTLDELQVAVDKAARDLSFTKVRAAVPGVFGNKGVAVGTLVQPGTRLGALIADNSLYVTANFKETQIQALQPGQPASVEVDALGGEVLHGTVESFAPGSGSVFSLLPPENATGNFTKIVQRVPVRIALPADDRTVKVLRPGLSVIVSIDTRTGISGGKSVAEADVPGAAHAATLK